MGAEIIEMEIEIDSAQLQPEAFRLIVTKPNELPIVWAAVVCE